MIIIIIIHFSNFNLWKHFAQILFYVFRKEIPHSIRVKPNENNKIIIEKDDISGFLTGCFYKGSGSKIDGKAVKLALKVLERRQQEEIEENEKKHLTDWMNVITEKLNQLMQK